MAGAHHELGAHAVAVHRQIRQVGDAVLVEITRHHDAGRLRASIIQPLPNPRHFDREIPRVDAHRTGHATETLCRGETPFESRSQVESVDEQRGLETVRTHLRLERRFLVVVRQCEGVGSRAGSRDAVLLAGQQVGGRIEAHQPRCTRSSNSSELVGAAAAHLDEMTTLGNIVHPCGCRRHRAIVVEHGEHQRFHEQRCADRSIDAQHRAARHIEVALAVAPGIAVEAEGRQVIEQAVAEAAEPRQVIQIVGLESVVSQQRGQPARPRDYAIAASRRQPPGEHLEARAPRRHPRLQGCIEHGQLVQVGHHGRAHTTSLPAASTASPAQG